LRHTLPALLALASLTAATRTHAQSDYRNVDGGRPVRTEDATATPRHALEAQLAAARLERFEGGMLRVQLEPRINFGAMPRTELKLRAPLAHRTEGRRPRSGLLGIAVGAFHSFNNESLRLPAFAVESEILLSASGAATGGATYALRGIATRTLAASRVHLNAGYGTYRVRLPIPGSSDGPVVPDAPCAVSPNGSGLLASTLSRCAGALRAAEVPIAERGTRLLAGAAIDRAFPLRSLLLVADVVVERYQGVLRSTDWTAEVGARRQLTPRSVLDAGIGYRFTGQARAAIATLGVTTSFAGRMLIPEAR
jgi:hypothetical protein